MGLTPCLRVPGDEVNKGDTGEIAEDLVVDLVLLVTPVVGVSGRSIHQCDVVKPTKHHQMGSKCQQRVVFVLSEVISNEGDGPRGPRLIGRWRTCVHESRCRGWCRVDLLPSENDPSPCTRSTRGPLLDQLAGKESR